LIYQEDTGNYLVSFDLWSIGERTTLALGWEENPLAPLPPPSMATNSSETTPPAVKSSLDTPRLQVAPLTAPWIAICQKSRLRHPEFCDPSHPDYVLRFLARSAEFAGNFLTEIEHDPARPDAGWREMAVSLLTAEEIKEKAVSKLNYVPERAEKEGRAAVIMFGRGECGTGYACYITSQRLIFVEERSQLVAQQTGFSLDDMMTHELFHAVQMREIPSIFSSEADRHETEWIVEGTASYVQSQSAGQSIFGNVIWNSPRDWAIPLKTSGRVHQTADSYKNHEFFAAITDGRKGDLATLLREFDSVDLANTYDGMGRMIHRLRGGELATLTRLEDPRRASLGGALLKASRNSVLLNRHRCNADIDSAADINEDEPVFRTRSLRPMTSHCRRIQSLDPDIIEGRSCIELEVPPVIADRDPVGTFQLNAPGFPQIREFPGQLEPRILVSGPMIDLQLLDLDSRRPQNEAITRRYSMKKVPCGDELPRNANTCSDVHLACMLTLDNSTFEKIESRCRVLVGGFEVFSCLVRGNETKVNCSSPSRYGTLTLENFGICDGFFNRILAEVLSPDSTDAVAHHEVGRIGYLRSIPMNELLPFDRRCGNENFCRVTPVQAK
jgi:hypothetical protein